MDEDEIEDRISDMQFLLDNGTKNIEICTFLRDKYIEMKEILSS